MGQRNIRVPDRNRTHDLPNTGRALYPLSYENSWRVRSFYWVHMWQVSCILLGSALTNSSWVVISEWRWWILSSVIKCKGWIIQHDIWVWVKEISESPTKIEPMTSWTPGGHSIHWTTRTHGEQGHFTEFMWQMSCMLLGGGWIGVCKSADPLKLMAESVDPLKKSTKSESANC